MNKNSAKCASESGGNTKPQIHPAKCWCFTLHNYTEEDISDIVTVCASSAKFSIFSKENGKSAETPHLQGYIEFKDKKRPKGMFKNNSMHWEKAKGKKEQNITYIKKERGDYWLNGEFIAGLKTIQKIFGWQVLLYKEICFPCDDDRRIFWVYDEEGGHGKSAFVKYMCVKYKAIVVSGKGADMKYGIMKYIEKHGRSPDIVFIDVPRSCAEYISYAGIEEVKNGCFFSSKYECDMCLFNSPHIVVMANIEPAENKFSEDRIKLITLVDTIL